MSRLDDLYALRDQIDREIEAERTAQARTVHLLDRVHVAITRGSWNTRVFTAVCTHFDVTGDDILEGRRDRATVDARHVAMWLMRDAGRPYTEIGRELDVDHTTVMYGVRRVNGDQQLLATAQAVRAALTGQEVDVA